MTMLMINLTDVDAFAAQEHHAQLAWLRNNDPVHWHPDPGSGGFWVLTRYDDVAAAYRDHGVLSSTCGAMLGGSLHNETDTSSGRMLVSSDPPRQRMLRGVMHQAFDAERIERIRLQVERLVDAALERTLADGGGDFATEVATELPAAAVMTMLGVSREDAHHLIKLTRRMIGFRDPMLVDTTAGDERLRLATTQAEIFEFFAELLRERRGHDGDDLLSILSRAKVNGRQLSEEDILYNCMNVAVGGNETSSYTACSGLLALLENPDQFELLRRRPDRLTSGINEILRWSSTNAYVQRVALADTMLGGRTVRAGESVTLWNVSANRDERQFPEPDRFLVERTPNRHLSYGMGIHRCIGATLAQVELKTLFARLLDDRLRITPAGDVARLRSNFILGITRMPLAASRV